METSLTLLERLANGPSDQDWRRLHDLYQPLLRAWLVRAGVPRADVEDLIQDILLVVFREVADFERRKEGAFRAWLKTILIHRTRNFFRSRCHQAQATGGSNQLDCLAQLEAPQSELSLLWEREHDEYLASQAMQRVQKEFAASTWQAFRRHVLEGRAAQETSLELGLSLNSVLLAKSRVLKRLRAELKGLVDG